MACELTKSTDTNARCDRSCSGEQSVAPSGAGHGLLVLRSTEDKLQPIVFAPMPRISGRRATVESTATGADRCTRCMVGQGEHCSCRVPLDVKAVRWLWFWLAVFWALIGFAVRSCAT